MSSINGKQPYVDSESAAVRETVTEHVFTVNEQVEMEQEHGIKYRSCTWQKVCVVPRTT